MALENLQRCRIIQLTKSPEDIDISALIPDEVVNDNCELYEEIEENLSDSVGMDDMPEDIFDALLENCLFKGKIRDAMLLTLHANMGVRNSDVSRIRVFEILKPDKTFRSRLTFGEQKTGKLRNFYINKAMQIAVACYLKNNPSKKMTDYLITSEGNRKKQETATIKLHDGNTMSYQTTSPLSRMQEERIIKDNLLEIGVSLRNDARCKGGEYKLNTHSLRKLYAEKFVETGAVLKTQGKVVLDTNLLTLVSLDLGHEKLETSLRYTHKSEKIKQEIVLNMNLGLNVWLRYLG